MLLAGTLFAMIALTACVAGAPVQVTPSPEPVDGLEAAAGEALEAWARGSGWELGSSNFTVVENDGASATVHASVMLRDSAEAAWLGHVADLYFDRSGERWRLLSEPRFDLAPAFQPRTLTGHTQCVVSVAFAGDGQTLASGSYDATARLWQASAGTELARLDNAGDRVSSVAFSPNSAILATGGGAVLATWDVAGGYELRRLPAKAGEVFAVAFSPDGRLLASAEGTAVVLRDGATGQELRVLARLPGLVRSLAFAPEGAALAAGGRDGSVRLWWLESGRAVQTIGHLEPVLSVAFSPDGKLLASGGVDRTVKVWDSNTGRLVRTLGGHTDWVSAVTFAPDGKTLLSGSRDGTIKVWSVETGRELRSLDQGNDTVRSVAVSPDGSLLAAGLGAGNIRLWRLN